MTFITDAEGRNFNVYGQSPAVPIAMTNADSDIDITFESVPEDHSDDEFSQFRPRFGQVVAGAGRRLDVTVINAPVILEDHRFGATSLSQVGGTATGRTDYGQINITAPTTTLATTIPGYAPVLPPRGTAPVGHLIVGGTTSSYLDLINPRLDPARVLLTRARTIASALANRVEMSTDIAIRAIAGSGTDPVGALASAFNGTGAGRTGGVTELTASGATIRRRVWSALGINANNDGTLSASPTFAATDDRATTVRIRRADLVFAERVVSVDTTVGANSVALDVRADPAFTSTPASAALLDQVNGARRFAVIEDTLATGVPRRRIIVYADSTLQQLYDWLKWEYSRAALPRQGDVSARPDRHDEALPVELAGGTLMLTEGWQIDIAATAELSPATNATALSLSSPYDHASPAWAATVGRTYTTGTVVTHLDRVWYCIQAAPVAQVPGSAAAYWVDVTAIGSVNYLVDGQNTGTLVATISLSDATGRTLTVVTEPGASYAYAETVVRERLRLLTANFLQNNSELASYDLDGTRHTEDDVIAPHIHNINTAIARDPATNDWVTGSNAPISSTIPPIIHRYDAVGHLIAESALAGV